MIFHPSSHLLSSYLLSLQSSFPSISCILSATPRESPPPLRTFPNRPLQPLFSPLLSPLTSPPLSHPFRHWLRSMACTPPSGSTAHLMVSGFTVGHSMVAHPMVGHLVVGHLVVTPPPHSVTVTHQVSVHRPCLSYPSHQRVHCMHRHSGKFAF